MSLCSGPCDEEAWEEFISRVGKPISQIVARTAALWGRPSGHLVEDLVQVTYLKLWERGRRLLRDFAVQRPEAILGYLKRMAANTTHDYFKHDHSQSSGGEKSHVSTSDFEPEAGVQVSGSPDDMAFGILVSQIDEHLQRSTTGPDRDRDRMIFWLYFRQGMTTQEIAALPAIGLTAKGIGSVIERLKSSIRDHILEAKPNPNAKRE